MCKKITSEQCSNCLEAQLYMCIMSS